MQRYHVNYPLLGGLIGVSVVTLAALYGLWRFQRDRTADSVYRRVAVAQEKGELRDAISFSRQYLAIRPNDFEAWIEHATLVADLAESKEASSRERIMGLTSLEEAVRRLSSREEMEDRLVELRRRLIDVYMKYGRSKDALEHIHYLLNLIPDDTELKVSRVRCLRLSGEFVEAIESSSRLLGYDTSTGEIDPAKAIAPDSMVIYRILADLLRQERNEEDAADYIIDQMVSVNPSSYEAYLQRSSYRLGQRKPEEAKEDILKAYELAPHESDAIITRAHQAIRDEEYGFAHDLLEKSLVEFPEDVRFYRYIAQVEIHRKNIETALSRIDQGIEKLGLEKSVALLEYKAKLQMQMKDVKGMRQTIKQMEEVNFPQVFREYLEARAMLIEGRWIDSSKELKRLRPLMVQLGGGKQLQNEIDFSMGICYERLAQWELAAGAFKRVLDSNPLSTPARIGFERASKRMGRKVKTVDRGNKIENLIGAELRKPKSEQNWDVIIEEIDDLAEERGLSEGQVKLVHAEIRTQQGKYKEAEELIVQAYKAEPDNLRVAIGAIGLIQANPNKGPVVAMKTVDAMLSPEKFGDLPVLRLRKADLFLVLKDDRVVEQLESLAQGIDDYTDVQKTQLFNGLALKFLRINKRKESAQMWQKVIDLKPNDLQTRVMLFKIARDAGDQEAMEDAQKEVLQVVGSKSSHTWLYCEVLRRLAQVNRGELDQANIEKELNEIQALLDKALKQRPEWHELHLARAEVETRRGNSELAIAAYQRAARFGRIPPRAIVKYVTLLVRYGRFNDARDAVEQVNKESRQLLLGQLYAEVLINTKSIEKGIESASKYIEAHAEDGIKQLWYGKLMQRVATMSVPDSDRYKMAVDRAEVAYQRSVELSPSHAETWLSNIQFLARTKKVEKANAAICQMQLALSEDKSILVLAKSYEILGRWFDAEGLFRSLLDSTPDNLPLRRIVAEFYLSPVYRKQDKVAKATALINTILRAVAEKKIPGRSRDAIWARSKGAEILAAKGDYQSLLLAGKLLASNLEESGFSMADRLRLADIYSKQSEPVSRAKAIRLFEGLNQVRKLDMRSNLTLAQLYFDVGEWQKCHDQFLELIARFPESAVVRHRYIDLLLQREKDDSLAPRRASVHLKKLIQLAPDHLETQILKARVWSRTGKTAEARKSILGLLPDTKGDLTASQLKAFPQVASLLVDMKEFNVAEKLYRFYASKAQGGPIILATYLGSYRDVDDAFKILEGEFKKSSSSDALRVGAVRAGFAIISRRSNDEGLDLSTHLETVEQWLARLLRNNPDSTDLLMLQGNVAEHKQDYGGSEAIYRKLLAMPELTGFDRAVVLNNLSFLLALNAEASGSKGEALQFVEEAIQILGPKTDILDTRAVAFIANKNYELAIQDLELAVTDHATASKYYHLAKALFLFGENEKAKEAWEQATELGIDPSGLNALERESFREMKLKLDRLSSQDAAWVNPRKIGEALVASVF